MIVCKYNQVFCKTEASICGHQDKKCLNCSNKDSISFPENKPPSAFHCFTNRSDMEVISNMKSLRTGKRNGC